MHNRTKGKRGEEIAAAYLKKKGYTVLYRNYTTELGELDLVVTDRKVLVFVEVKARFGADYGYPSEAVTYHKRQKINQVASQYLKQFRLFDVAVRFDVVEVFLSDGTVHHIENAFDSYLRY